MRKRICDPGFVYQPLTVEQKARASQRMKAIWAAKRGQQGAELTGRDHSDIVGIARSYYALVEAIRRRVEELKLTRLEVDRLSGVQDGYSAKLLARKNIKVFGKLSTGLILEALGLELVIVKTKEGRNMLPHNVSKRTRRSSTGRGQEGIHGVI